MNLFRTVLRRRVLGAGLTLLLACAARAQPLEAPNVVVIGPQRVTSGQPTPAALRDLGRQGFQAVVYLAPFSMPDAVKDEPEILQRQGIEFIHIPIPFGRPDETHARAVSEALTGLAGKKVLVHCQVNMRASSMVFLHRVLVERIDPAQAYAAVTAVWSPQGPWMALIRDQLNKNGIAFEPY
jgi:protein tyrosine phosphatase (PTP) superfamily phosphohydrolase (DUF442 family)